MLRSSGLLLLTIGAVFGASCFAQDLSAVRFKVIRNAPFSAEAITESKQVLPDGNQITHKTVVTIARDSEGRTRRQEIAPGSVVVFIHDPVEGVAYVLDSNKKTAKKIAVATASESAPATSTGDGESLGSQIMEGLQVEGKRITRNLKASVADNQRPLTATIDVWYSEELQTIVSRTTEDPRVGEVSYKLTKIQQREPSSSLFKVPQGYAIREETPGVF